MPKPPQTYIKTAQTGKVALAAKDSKAKLAVAKAEIDARHALDLLAKRQIDQRKLAEIKKLIDDFKKGKLGDRSRQALLQGVKLLLDVAKHQGELAQASASLAGPAKAVAGVAAPVTAALQQLARPGAPAPANLGNLLAPVLLLAIVIEKFLAGAKRPK